MSERTRPSTETIRRGRLKKAVEFLDGAVLIEDEMPDAAVSLWSMRALRLPMSYVVCALVYTPPVRITTRPLLYSPKPTPGQKSIYARC